MSGLQDEGEKKLASGNKRSTFEKQKADAEAKRVREEAETAAAYQDFVKSFDDDDSDGNKGRSGGYGTSSRPQGFQGSSTSGAFDGGRRQFASGPSSNNRVSGPGSLGPVPQPPGPPNRKRPFSDVGRDIPPSQFKRGDSGLRNAFQQSGMDLDDGLSRQRDQDRASNRPALQLINLPPSITETEVKALIPTNLNVEKIELSPLKIPPGSFERPSTTAIVYMSGDTPAVDLDNAVSALQNKYVGIGYYLSLSRHLSSATLHPPASTSAVLPFGAKLVNAQPSSLSRAPPPSTYHKGGIAPPSSYNPSGPRPPTATVIVKPPTDLSQLRMIHMTIETLLKQGPQFELLLMGQPSVQSDPRWSWLYDSSSQAGVYYRWRIWDIMTSAQKRMKTGTGWNDGGIQMVFEDGPFWDAREAKLPFEFVDDDFVDCSDYNSSEDEDSGDEARRRIRKLQGPVDGPAEDEEDTPRYLNPFRKAKLIHLLERLPTSHARLRRGDVARVTAFAVKHAVEAISEVVDILIDNVLDPYNLSESAIALREDNSDSEGDRPSTLEKDDPSLSKLIGLYLISDILSSSSTSSVRHAWRYRTCFESAFLERDVFVQLGRQEREYGWGKLRADKWRRQLLNLLALWEGWSVFSGETHEMFVKQVETVVLTDAEKKEVEAEKEREREGKAVGRWKTVQSQSDEKKDDGEGERMELDNEEDLDGEAMPMSDEDEDLDGVPMESDDEAPSRKPELELELEVAAEKPALATPPPPPPPTETAANKVQEARRKRPRAEDMFADSDGE